MERPAIAFLFALLAFGSTGCFDISSDTQALRDSVTKSVAVDYDPQFEIGVGALTFNLVRTGFAFVDLAAEQRNALSAVRSADVGVYHLRCRHQRLDHARMLSAADDVMLARGWDRIVGVVNQRELVAIYLPQKARSARNVKICLVVLDGEKLVVASARSHLEPLMELALRQSNARGPFHL